MKVDLVFEGGGIKGLAFVGSVCCLEDHGYEFERCAGTSSGSIISTLVSVGYTGKELKKIILNTDFNKFIENDKYNTLESTFRLMSKNGIYNNSYVYEWITELLSKKNKLKFKDVFLDNKSRLKIIASDITKKDIVIMPNDLINYDIDPMEFEIAKAVQMSTSIPFYFQPVKLENKNSYNFIVDGGLLSNFPIWIFDVEGTPRWPTFGFNLISDEQSYTSQGERDIISFTTDTITTVFNRNENIYIREKDSIRTINVPTLGVKTTDFNISKELILKLFDEGYKSTETFLNTWNFEEYLHTYRM